MDNILDSRTLDMTFLGEKLFGRGLRLRVAAWVVGASRSFYQAEAADGVRYSASAVAQELERLVELGMLIRHDKPGGDRRQYYSRTDSSLWRVITTALEMVDPTP